jgi:hypothetical protein
VDAPYVVGAVVSELRYVQIKLDDSLEPGKYRVGGVRIAESTGDAVWRALRTTVVFARDEDAARALAEMVSADPALELTE